MKVLPSGDKAVLVEFSEALEARIWAERLVEHLPVTLGATTVLVHAPRSAVQPLLTALSKSSNPHTPAHQGQAHTITVHYDGPDLHRVAGITGMSPDQVITAHTSCRLTVGFAGFAPGFAYLIDGDPRLQVPRLDVPRPHVAAGSVALAGAFSGIYPRESAGGWLIIGRTKEWLWDTERERPARLRPGDTVHFEAI